MEPSWKNVLEPSVTFVLALATLSFTWTKYTPLVIRTPRGGERQFQQKSMKGDIVTLSYNFKDRFMHDVTFGCGISQSASKELNSSFGLAICSKAPVKDGLKDDICLKGVDKVGEKSLLGSSNKYMRDRGFTQHEEGGVKAWVLDYRSLVARSFAVLSDCRRSFDKLNNPTPETLMSFFLAMPTTDKPDPEVDPGVNKWVAGFRLPSDVMTDNKGDCDSRAALFCALIGNSKRKVVILRSVPRLNGSGGYEYSVAHALIGVAVENEFPDIFPERFPDHWEEGYLQPGKYPEGFEFGNDFAKRKYIPIEVNVSGRIEYGEVGNQKGYEILGWPYVAIPVIPLQSDLSAGALQDPP